MARQIIRYRMIDHGIEHPQYFQGCGAGNYESVSTGIGQNQQEAYDDALEQLAWKWNIEDMPQAPEILNSAVVSDDQPEHYYYFSIRVR